jgi:hypothetical protein
MLVDDGGRWWTLVGVDLHQLTLCLIVRQRRIDHVHSSVVPFDME